MTRKDYIQVASAMLIVKPSLGATLKVQDQHNYTLRMLCKQFVAASSSFNEERFIGACGGFCGEGDL
jgi:hypothetical protein